MERTASAPPELPVVPALPAGRRIAVAASPGPLHAAVLAACRRDGAAYVPLDARAPPEALARDLAQVGADAAVHAEGTGPPWSGPTLAAGRGGFVAAGVWPGPGRDVGERIVLRTSGTTGPPKVVALREAQLAAHAAAVGAALGQDASSVVLACIPPWHAGGAVLLDRAQRLGSTVRWLERWDAVRALQALEGATHVSLVPAQLAQLVDAGRPPESLRCVLVGGDALPEALFRRAVDAGWPVHPSYGLTETCGVATVATPEERRARPGTSGRPLPGMRLRIEDGMVVVDGPTVAAPVATGDVGRIEDGFLYVDGRNDDRITTGGEKVDPARVEDALRTHPAIADACVVGLPDATYGQLVAAALVVRSTVTSGEMRAHLAPLLKRHEVPRVWRIVKEVPRTPGGKAKRAEMRARLQEAT